MATAPVSQTLNRGGSFLITSTSPEDVFTPADLTDDQRLIGQTAEEFVQKEILPNVPELEAHKEGLMAQMLKKAGEIGLLGGAVPEEYGGGGPRQNSLSRPPSKIVWLRVLCRLSRRSLQYRNNSNRLFRHRRAEKKISAQDRHGRTSFQLLPLRTAGWLGFARRSHARGAFARRQELDFERPKNVDYEWRVRRCVHSVRQSRR